MNVIFGSGIVGLLAKLILGPSWVVIPFYRSRFFSFNPALDDNFIIKDDEIEQFIKEITDEIVPQTFLYRRAWSIQGQLLSDWNNGLCFDWFNKIFGINNIPRQSEIYYHNRMDLQVYDIRLNTIYQRLIDKFLLDLKTESSKGAVTEIGDHYFMRDGTRYDFDLAISTIPLDILYNLMNVNADLQAKDIHYLHIQTKNLDFEGYNQTFVVDPAFDFFKVTNIAPDRYLIYCHENIQDPGMYFMNFIQKFEILDGTSIEHAIPIGQIPKSSVANNAGIYCVGSYAQWDWCMDIGSCILRIIRYMNREYKTNKPKQIKLP